MFYEVDSDGGVRWKTCCKLINEHPGRNTRLGDEVGL